MFPLAPWVVSSMKGVPLLACFLFHISYRVTQGFRWSQIQGSYYCLFLGFILLFSSGHYTADDVPISPKVQLRPGPVWGCFPMARFSSARNAIMKHTPVLAGGSLIFLPTPAPRWKTLLIMVQHLGSAHSWLSPMSRHPSSKGALGNDPEWNQ